MILSTINKDSRLYVIRAGAGYTTYGFDVLNVKAANVLDWLKNSRHAGRAAEMILGAKGIDLHSLEVPARVGTKKHFAACVAVLEAGRVYCLASGTRCDVELSQQLTGLVGRRVEVVDRFGEKRRFIVGRSSGWLPVHLEVLRKDSAGGAPVSGIPFKSVKVIA